MMRLRILIALVTLTFSTSILAHEADPGFDHQIQAMLNHHYNKYKDSEYFTGIALTIYIPGKQIKNFYIGTESRDKDSKKISPSTLFQIGSITKSFTSAIILQLENENKIKIDDKLANSLTQYPKWGDVTIRSLLDMTSGVPNYTDTPFWNVQESDNISRVWTNQQLIAFVYPTANFAPPMRKDYYYTNSAYVLAGMVIEKLTSDSFLNQVNNRIIKPLNLANTFYPTQSLDPQILSRQAHGYYYNQYDSPNLVGKDVTANDLSWAGAAGAMLSTPEDVALWIHELFAGNKILKPEQHKELTQIVSLNTGKPLKHLTADDDRGFGLGVIQAYDNSSPQGNYWFYEGETLGFRAIYSYTPCNGVIIAAAFNSATNPDNDYASTLANQIYDAVLDEYPELTCKGM